MTNTLHKTIAKNTLFLYFRMFLIMGITLYTSRIVLEELGISDFGLYSLVGGVVAMFGFFNAAMSSATQRYLSYDIGSGDKVKLQKTFSAALTLHFFIAILGFILAETIGLWYINYKMVIPNNSLFSVILVYQFSVLTFIVSIIQVPYNALIISHEQMKVYAYMSIIEAVLKLGIVFLLMLISSNKLIAYSIFVFIVTLMMSLFYQIYCRKRYVESIYKFEYDKEYYKELVSYSGWNLFGNIASIARNQGVNIIINLFFGTVLNAAYAITNQMSMAVSLFVTNLQTAFNPQIIKHYSKGMFKETEILIFQGSKFSFLLILLIIMPILLNTEYILTLWLSEVPLYTTVFVKLALINILIDSLSGSLMVGIQATGRIKWYQIVVGLLVFFNLPFTYFAYKAGLPPEFSFYISIIISFITLQFRIVFLNKVGKISIKKYYLNVILRSIIVLILSFVLLWYLGNNFVKKLNFTTFCLQSMYIFLLISVIIFLFGLSKQDRLLIKSIIKNKVSR